MNNIEVPVVGAGRRKGISFSLFRGPTLPLSLSLSLSSEEEGAIGVKLVRETLCNLYLREKVIDLSLVPWLTTCTSISRREVHPLSIVPKRIDTYCSVVDRNLYK